MTGPTVCQRAAGGTLPGVLRLVVWLAVAWWLPIAATVAAGEPPSIDESAPLEFRRVFVVDEALSKLALDGWYLPVRRESFEQLVRSAAMGGDGADSALQSRIVQATYTARLMGTQRLGGEAQLQIVHRGERESALVLEPCNLVIQEMDWRPVEPLDLTGESSQPPTQPRIGFDEHGQFTVVASGSGTLDLNWTMRSLPDSTDSPAFVLRLPECPLTQVVLELPGDLQPLTNQGFVTLDTTEIDGESWNRWIWDVGGHSRLYLRLAPFPGSESSQREMLIRQQSVYRFTPQDVQLTLEMQLDILNEPLNQLAMTADPALRLIQVTHTGRQLRWTEQLSDQRRELLLEMPEPLIGLDHRIRLEALAPVELGRTWQLPTVHVEPGLWSHAAVRLELPETLVLDRLDLRGCRQTGAPVVGTGGAGESVTLEGYDPQAKIAVALSLPDQQIQVRRGTSVTVGRNRTSLVHSAHFTTDGPPRFELTLTAPLKWSIDQIESQPPEILEEWSFAGRSGASRLIQIRLREPLAPATPLLLKIWGHSDGLRSGAVLAAEGLRLGEYQGTSTADRLFAVSAEPPFQIRLEGDGHLERLAATELEADQLQLVNVASGSVLFRDGPGMDEMTIELRSEPPDYAVRIDTECEVSQRRLDSQYRIRVQPNSSAIERLQVHFTGPPEQRIQWSDRDGALPVTARRLPPDAAGGSDGETWQVTLPEPSDAPFELHALQSIEFEKEASLSLAALPGATSQVGTVTIRSADALPLQFAVQNVRAIPAEPLAAGRSSTTRAVYRYDPSQDCRISIQHALEAMPRTLAWVWSCDLVTRHYRDGKTLHVAEYRVEDSGAAHMTLTTPEAVEWVSARVDGRDVPLGLEAVRSTQLSIPLPRGTRFPTVQVRYVAQGKPLGSFGDIVAVWPACDQQIFRRSWVAWLPPGFACLSGSPSSRPDSWQQRLLGSLLRSSDTRPFAPWSSDSWMTLLRPGHESPLPPDWQDSAKWLEGLWAEYERLLDSASEQSMITWGGLLRIWQTTEDAPGNRPKEVWIDQFALGAEGIAAQSLVPAPVVPGDRPAQEGSAAAQGASLLTAARLALLIDGNRLLLTTVPGLFDRTEVISLPGLLHTFALPPGDSESLLAEQPDRSRWIRLESWSDQPPLPQACWQHSEIPTLHQSGEIAGNSGWTVQRIPAGTFQGAPSDSTSRSRSAVYQPVVMQSLGWAAFLAAMGLTVWLVQRYLPLAWPLAGLAGLAVLFVPVLWVPVFQCLFLGTVLGGLLALVRAGRVSPGPILSARQELPTTSLFVRTLVLALLLTWLVGQATAADGTESGVERTSASNPMYQILSPIDAEGDPQGEYVYVPADFYERLLQKAAPLAGESLPWMIYDAAYQATMNWNATEEKLSVVELSVTYDLEVFRPDTTVRLPIVESQAHLLPNRALLDGRPATVRWLEENGGLALDIDSVGRYRIALALRPHVLRNGDFDRFEVAIPRVANSHLRLELPTEVKEMSFPTALGASIPDLGAGNWLVQLGPTERLVARWPTDVERSSVREVLELDQLLWLRVRPDAVQLDARLRFSQFASPITRVDLIADHRLRLLPPADDAPIAWYESTRGSTQIIHLEFKPPHQQEVEFDLSFIMEDTASIGRIHLPALTSSADRVSRRWLGVSIDPQLVCLTEQPDEQGSPTPAEFLNAWEPLASAPQQIIDLASANRPSSLLVHPREPQVSSQQRTEVVCRPGAAELTFQADLKLVHGTQLQYDVVLPAAVTVEHVTLEEAGQPRLRSWVRDAQGRLTLRLNQPVRQDQRLEIHGRLDGARPSRGDSLLEIPDWTIVGVERQSQLVDVYRHERVQVRPVEFEGYQVRDGFAEGVFSAGRGRWIASLAIDSEVAEPRLRLRMLDNRPSTTGQMVTAVRRESEGWWAEVHLQLTVTGGVMDVLRLEVPADWKGPFQVPEGMTAILSELPGKGRSHLLLRPEQPVRGEFRVQFRGPISSASRERIRVPDVALLDSQRIENFVLLPTRVDQQRIVWERSGLQAKPLPEPLRSLRGPADLPYGALRPRFQATIKDIQLESGLAFVRLADHCVELDTSGRLLGVSSFDLEPAGHNECRLIVPEGYQVLHVTVANLPVSLLASEEQQWRVPLGSPQLPQRIQILFTGQLRNGASSPPVQSLRGPVLQGLPIDQTAWTIRYPADTGWQVVATEAMTAPEALDWLRMRSLAELITRAEEVLKDGDPEEIVRWYVPWMRRWTTARSRLAPDSPSPAESVEQAEKELTDFDEEHRRIAERLGVQAHALLAGHEARYAFESSDVWRMVAKPQQVSRTLITSSPSEFPRMMRVEEPAASDTSTLAALSMLAGLTLLGMLLLPHPALDDLLRRHPEILGIVFGALWWWAFAASAAGFLLFCVSMTCFVLRLAGRRRRRLATSSKIPAAT